MPLRLAVSEGLETLLPSAYPQLLLQKVALITALVETEWIVLYQRPLSHTETQGKANVCPYLHLSKYPL